MTHTITDIIIEILPDGHYAISKEDYEAQQEAWMNSIKNAKLDAYEEAAKICELGSSVPIPNVSRLEKDFVRMAVETSAFLAKEIRALKDKS